jgi:hypothetical protein
MFSPDPPLSVRHEFQLFMRGCEHLLSTVSVPYCEPLTEAERRTIEYYGEKFIKAIGAFVRE